jgi:kynurenine formamidase
MTDIIDLTHPIYNGVESFPHDPKVAIIPHGKVETHQYNISQIVMGSHQGTHLDAMYHFFDDGRTLDKMPLEWFIGPAHCLQIPKGANETITVEDLQPHEACLQPEARIIVNTGWYHRFGKADFFEDFPSFSLEAATYLAERKIRMLGMDIPTPGVQWLALHHILLAPENEIVVVESLANLDDLPATFHFIGLPLNFKGRDGSPIRAVAVCEK